MVDVVSCPLGVGRGHAVYVSMRSDDYGSMGALGALLLMQILHEDQAVRAARRASQIDRRALVVAELYGVQLVPHQTAVVQMFLRQGVRPLSNA